MTFWKSKFIILLALSGFVFCEPEDDTSTVFMEAAQALFENKEAIGGLQSVARAFMQPDGGKQVSDYKYIDLNDINIALF